MADNGKSIVFEKAKNRDWGLCIFFSVDLENATAYKAETRAQKGDEDWCAVFETFYEDFYHQLLGEYLSFERSGATIGISDPIEPCLWKFVGDEILFYAPLTDARQTLEHIRSFGQAIILYNDRLRDEGKNVQCKGTAWIGGFPVNNRIVITQDSNIDFIGSSIDCGFRLTKYSSPRRLVVSLDLLWMFAESFLQCTKSTFYRAVQFKYHGEYELKGVFSGKRYPVFWYDLNYEGECIEEQWLPQQPYCGVESIIAFCNKVVKKAKKYDFIRPFIHNDLSGLFTEIPDTFEQQRQELPAYKEKGRKALPGVEEKQKETGLVVLPEDALSPSVLNAS